MMEYSAKSPIKIIWSVLTGYDWDTGAAESWSARSASLSNVKSPANQDIDIQSFMVAIQEATFNLTGYIEWDEPLVEALQKIILHFLGSIYINEAGQVTVYWFKPKFGSTAREFSNTKKIYSFEYRRDISDVINYVTVAYKKRDIWDWEDVDFVYDGFYVSSDATSIGLYGRLAKNLKSRWYSANCAHVGFLAPVLVTRYASPPFITRFKTGSDAFYTKLGEVILVTDAKAAMSAQRAEVVRLRKDFTSQPRTFEIDAVFETPITWAFLGSSANEGDGESPQAGDFDNATGADKRFAYLGHREEGNMTTHEKMNTAPPGAFPKTTTGSPTIITESSDGERITLRFSGSGDVNYQAMTGTQWANNVSPGNIGMAGIVMNVVQLTGGSVIDVNMVFSSLGGQIRFSATNIVY